MAWLHFIFSCVPLISTIIISRDNGIKEEQVRILAYRNSSAINALLTTYDLARNGKRVNGDTINGLLNHLLMTNDRVLRVLSKKKKTLLAVDVTFFSHFPRINLILIFFISSASLEYVCDYIIFLKED
jgi:hypothetical protein